MCGLAGLWDIRGRFDAQTASQAVRRMTDAIRHRGPDDAGIYQDSGAGLVLGHRRLSIVDLSPLGHQPMLSADGRYVIVFNGEVFNHHRLRPELIAAGAQFRGHSDTEVMLASIQLWGVERAVSRFIGMFAFALWDKQERTLTLARDRVGIKPLYYGWVAGTFAFASELKALKALPDFANPVDRNSLTLQLRHNYVPAPYSIYSDIYKLMPGTLLTVDADFAEKPAALDDAMKRARSYWSAKQLVEHAAANRERISDTDAIEELDALLRDSIALRMEADVPLGAFLSGGVDSSVVVALMQAQSSRPVKTFSIGFHEHGYDEAPYAKAVAAHLGTDHQELYVTPEEALAVVPRLPHIFDEPFSDSSQIPTYLVSELARKQVTVSLSGDGGDELFAGYNRYFFAPTLRRGLDLIPGFARRPMSRHLRAHSDRYGNLLERVTPWLPRQLRLQNPNGKMDVLARMLGATTAKERYRDLVSHWHQPELIVRDGHEPSTALTDPDRQAMLADNIEYMMYTDLVSYLPDDILVKVDRASMAASLEARVPLLDHRVVEFSWRVPMQLKLRHGKGKWLLRQVLKKYVPEQLIERPKMGFGVPIDRWLRGPLRDWAETLLSAQRLRDEGYFDPVAVRAMWKQHVEGTANEHYRLWDVLMFQAWNETQTTAMGMNAYAA